MSTYPLVALGNVLTPADDAVAVDPAKEYPIAGIFSFGKGVFARGRVLGAETSYKKLTSLRADQLVFGRLNAWEGGIAVVDHDSQGLFVSQEFPVLDIDRERAAPAYIANLCRWPDLWEALMGRSRGLGARSGARRLRVHEDRLLEVEVPLPDVDEQRRVARKLNAIAVSLDGARSRIDEAKVLSGVLGVSMQFRPDLDDDAKRSEGWTYLQLGDIASLAESEETVDPTRTYRTAGVYSFGRGLFDRGLMDGSATSYRRLSRLSADNVVMSRLKAWEGALAFVSTQFDGAYVSPEFPQFEIDGSSAVPRFIGFLISTQRFWESLAEGSKGIGARRERVSAERLLSQRIWLPSMQDQRVVVSKLESLQEVNYVRELNNARAAALNLAALNYAFAGLL